MNLRSPLVYEGLLATAGLIALTHLLVRVPVFRDSQSLIFTVLCIYVPITVLGFRRRSLPLIERDGRTIMHGLAWFFGTSLLVFPLFTLAAHGWQTWIVGLHFHGFAPFPSIHLLAIQLGFVGLPEEFFFRGYLQPTLESAFRPRWRILEADLGWGWILTSLVFAFAHSAILAQWWHFAIFLPALLFGYLRARTGGLTAPILFHTASNLVMDWIARSYMH